MKTYICMKTICAAPVKMVNGVFWPEGLPLPDVHETPEVSENCANACDVRIEEGYMFTISPDDKYPQYMSADEFGKFCRSTENMTFGDALEVMKQGGRAARRGWNGKGQFVELASCVSYVNRDQMIVNVDHKNIGNKALAFVGTSGVQLGWLASQADMLADDWYIVE